MLQIIVQGRGGQGAQTAGNLLAMAFFDEGRQVQSFATYGGARKGTPVSSFIRVDARPIRLRCDIEQADAILCFDASLLQGRLLDAAREDALIVVNSAKPAAELAGICPGRRLVPIDGMGIARSNGLGRIVNSALLGGFVHALGMPSIETMTRIIAGAAPVKRDENVAACHAGYAAAAALESAPDTSRPAALAGAATAR